MNRAFILVCLFTLIPLSPVMAQTKPTLWIIGDSTVHNGTKGEEGWGDPIKALFDLSKIEVDNRAMGGRSSRTFRTEGRWQDILDKAKPGDFVIMQFGHNDSSPLVGDNRERGSLRGNGDDTKDVTKKDGKAETVHSYGWYMRQYVKEAKDKGMIPIVCSYIPHCPKVDAKDPTSKPAVSDELTSYPLWASQAASAEGGLFIDLHKLIAEKYATMTAEEIKKQYFTDADDTHTNSAGAKLNAQCVVDGLRQLKDNPLAGYLLPPGSVPAAK